MDESVNHINLSGKELEGLPLFFRKIYFNSLTTKSEEAKLLKYSLHDQCLCMRDEFPKRQISKTVDYRLIKNSNDD